MGAVAKAVEWKGKVSRCDNLSQLVVEIGRLLEGWTRSEEGHEGKNRFVLVFDGIDRQRDAPPTLLPALARLGEIVSSPLSLLYVSDGLDTPSNHNLYNHLPAPQFSPRSRRPTYLLPSIHQARTPLHPLPHNTYSPPAKRPSRNAGYLVPLLQRRLGLHRQTLLPLSHLLPRPLPHTLAALYSPDIKQPAVCTAIQQAASRKQGFVPE